MIQVMLSIKKSIILCLLVFPQVLLAKTPKPGWRHVAASRIATNPVLVTYVTWHDPMVVAQIEGIPTAGKMGIELTIRSEFPTQLRLYLTGDQTPGATSGEEAPAGKSPPRFRYLVFSRTMLDQKLIVPLSAFDPDPFATDLAVAGPCSLIIKDCPGFLRAKLANHLAVGPLKMLDTAPPPSPDEVPPGPERDGDEIFRRVLGGWIGKVAGGEAGMPYEGRLDHEVSIVPVVERGLPATTWGFGPDDDSSFEVMHLIVARERGPGFGPQDLIRSWLRRYSPEYLWKTERRTLDLAKKQASHETFGTGPQGLSLCARIRCDIWGYLNPSDPASAIALVEREAPLSNYGTGIQSARFIAAATSLAFNCGRVVDLLNKTLEVIGENGGEHSEMVRWLLARKEAGDTLESLRGQIDERFFDPAYRQDPDSSWAYALHNDALVILSLLFGEEDFGRSVSLASILGHDTDCNAATVGSLLGVMGGANRIPERFTSRIGDRLRAAIPEQEHWSIRRLAHLTRSLVRNTK